MKVIEHKKRIKYENEERIRDIIKTSKDKERQQKKNWEDRKKLRQYNSEKHEEHVKKISDTNKKARESQEKFNKNYYKKLNKFSNQKTQAVNWLLRNSSDQHYYYI